MWLAWHIAAFQRVKRLPQLASLLTRGDPRALSERIKAAFKAYRPKQD